MRIQFDKARWAQDSDGFWLSLRVKFPAQARQFSETIQPKLYDADLKIHREKRSLDANSYLWVIAQKIAEAVRNITKEAVYRDAVKHAGQFQPLIIENDAVETFVHKWGGHGIGWFAEKAETNIPGYTQVIAYYGSSVYDSREMSILLDYIINEAQDMGIETATPDEIAKMEALWGEKQSTA
ncbi:conserved protein of unknown function [Ruminococcaceae bacterium BL-6]|nr:conserved protein of unknown function [Ruminococcaceae bacterium BL-6]